MSHGVVIDLITIAVMTVAVIYAVKLNRSLMRARDGRGELLQLIASLTESQQRAEHAIQTMKGTAADYELDLRKQIAISRGLIDELSMINETGNTIANRLERLAPLARAGEGQMRVPEPEPSRPAAAVPLRAERPGAAAPRPTQPRPAAPASQPAQAAAPAEAARPRSRAENELFAAIETLRKGKPS